MALAAIALGACNSEPKFKVEGEVSGADGKMLYLEASALEGIVPLDSVKLEGGWLFPLQAGTSGVSGILPSAGRRQGY